MNIEDLKKIIISSNNYSEVLRKIDLVTTNGNYHTLKKIIKINNLDVSHFNRKTKKDNSTFDKINLDEVLKKNTNYNSTRIRNRLISEGIKEHKCENCKNTEWLNKPIPLQLHHINGVRSDNTIENLSLLCPNCHVLTDNFGSKNAKKKRVQPLKNILTTKKYINKENLRSWFLIGNTYQEVSEINNINIGTLRRWVKEENLQDEILKLLNKKKLETIKNDKEYNILKTNLIKCGSFLSTGKIMGLSDNGVRKKCKKYLLPTNKNELKIWIEKQKIEVVRMDEGLHLK